MIEERLRFEIATKVMGLEVEQATYVGYEELLDFADKDPKYEMFYWPEGSMDRKPLPMYPRNMSDCWQAVEQIVKTWGSIDHVKFSEWYEEVQLWTLPEREAATMICKAILTIYGLQEEKEVDDYAIPPYN
jgi:hypothetical protein